MKVFYRISDNGYDKSKIVTKKQCLLNFLTHWSLEEITVFADRCVPETVEFLNLYSETTGLKVEHIDGGSSAASWRVVFDRALTLPDDEIVYFVEDDYLHTDHSRRALLEAVERSDYVTLYDAPDKYVPAKMGGNPLIPDEGGEVTQVILTPTSHWKITNSTTMTFACKVKTLREDADIWRKYTSGTHPHDFNCFLELRSNGRSLLSPIPSFSTHCEPNWLAPRIDWETVI